MSTQKPATFIALILGAAILLAFAPLVLPPFYVRVGQLMLYSAGLAVAWTILGGFAGYASFGHAAFIGVGAFAAGLAEQSLPDLPTGLLLPAGMLADRFNVRRLYLMAVLWWSLAAVAASFSHTAISP